MHVGREPSDGWHTPEQHSVPWKQRPPELTQHLPPWHVLVARMPVQQSAFVVQAEPMGLQQMPGGLHVAALSQQLAYRLQAWPLATQHLPLAHVPEQQSPFAEQFPPAVLQHVPLMHEPPPQQPPAEQAPPTGAQHRPLVHGEPEQQSAEVEHAP